MQVTQVREVTTNVQNSVNFSVSDDSAKLFSMLSSALYQNKEQAVCFELGANCYDANPNEPFHVIAPTYLDPTIKFRDFGPGLSEHDVYRLLTVYGASSKTDSNTSIGGYGIGAKSPAAVTDTWNVISYHNKKGMDFLVFINDHGIPSLTKIREFDTEETGLEVIIPVAQNRFDIWKSVLSTCFKHYPVKPIIKNASVNYVADVFSSSGSCWKIKGAVSQNLYNTATFITTHRGYSIDTEKLELEFKNDSKLKYILRMPIVIDFDIGELSLSLSRENIQYTKTTVAAIKHKLEIVEKELTDQCNAILNTAENEFEFKKKVHSLSDIFGEQWINHNSISQFVLTIVSGKYNINNLHDDIRTVIIPFDSSEEDLKLKFDVLKPRVINKDNMMQSVNFGSTCFKTRWIIVDSRYNKQLHKNQYQMRMSIQNLDKIQIVIDDIRGSVNRVKYAMANGTLGHTKTFAFLIKENIFPKDLKPYIILASSLSSVPKATRTKKEKKIVVKKSDVYAFTNSYMNSFTKMNENDIDRNLKCAYVTFTDGRKASTIINKNWYKMVSVLKKLEYTVYGVKTGVSPPSYLITIEEAIQREFDNLDSPEMIKAMTVYRFLNQFASKLSHIQNVGGNNLARVFKFCSSIRTKTPSLWNKIQDEYQEMKNLSKSHIASYNTYDSYLILGNILGKTTKSIETDLFDKIGNEIYNTYPMLKLIDAYISIDSYEIADYLNLVGK